MCIIYTEKKNNKREERRRRKKNDWIIEPPGVKEELEIFDNGCRSPTSTFLDFQTF